jgi:hypothetical protein
LENVLSSRDSNDIEGSAIYSEGMKVMIAENTVIKSSRFKPATREKLRLRMAIEGPSGSGKTYTALRAATALGKTIAVINTESKSIQKYIGEKPDGIPFQFAVDELHTFAPSVYAESILHAGKDGFDVLIIDSLSHAWEGEGGALDQIDRSKEANRFTAWKDVTPQHRRMVDAILRSPCHVIVTMRTKTEYVLETNEKGKMAPKKIGMKAIQREGMEYEFDVVLDLDNDHVMKISKTRCPAFDGLVSAKPGRATFLPLVEWLEEGVDAPEGYYTVTEEDLKNVEDVKRSLKSPEQLRAEGIAAQKAALAGGSGAGVKVSPVEVAAPVNGSSSGNKKPAAEPRTLTTTTPVDEPTKKKIKAAWEKTGKPVAEFTALLKSHGVGKLGELTQLQADELHGEVLRLATNAGTDSARKEIAEVAATNAQPPQAGAEAQPEQQATTETTTTAKGEEAAALTGTTPTGKDAQSHTNGINLAEVPDRFQSFSADPSSRTDKQKLRLTEIAGATSWRPTGAHGTDAFLALHGAPSWKELSERDTEVAITYRLLVKEYGADVVLEKCKALFCGKLPVALESLEMAQLEVVLGG